MSAPRLDAIGIVVRDMQAAIRFYTLLGLSFPENPGGQDHIEATTSGGLRVMLDSVELMKTLLPGYVEPQGHRIGLAFHCGDAAGVDATYARLVEAGFPGVKPPWDAFWGQRYAQVRDPDGNLTDLFAPLR